MANALSLLRILLSLPTVLAIGNGQLQIALILVALGAFTDLLDGKVARANDEATNIGKLLDPLADKVFVLSALIALVEAGKVGSLPVVLLLLRELGVSFLRSVAVGHGIILEASLLGKIKTSLEFLALVLFLAEYPVGVHALWVCILLAYVSAYDYLRVYLKAMSDLNYP